MQRLKEFYNNKFYMEMIISIVLFLIAMSTNSVIEIVVGLLYFIIILEVVRAVMSFLREKRVKIRFLIDAFIILALRDFIVNVVKINKEEFNSVDALLQSSTNFHIMIFSGVVLFLFILRWLAYFTSPDKIKNEGKK